eukprot:5138149-Amphidinium_carterae.1
MVTPHVQDIMSLLSLALQHFPSQGLNQEKRACATAQAHVFELELGRKRGDLLKKQEKSEEVDRRHVALPSKAILNSHV